MKAKTIFQYIKIGFILLFGLFFKLNTHGQTQNLKITSFTLADGLSNTHITCIEQDAKGFIWIGTEDGLNRFDGKSFLNFFHYDNDKTSLPSSAIYSLFLDENKQLWVGTFSGLCRYDYSSGKFIAASIKDTYNKQINSPIKAITKGGNNELWLGTSGDGLILYNTKTTKATFYKHQPNNPKSIASNHISEILVDNQTVWVGNQDDGVSVLNLVNQDFENLNISNNNLKNNTILSIFKNTDKSIWVGTFGGGISVFNSKKELISQFLLDENNPQSINSNIVFDIKQDKKQQIWLGTEGGGLNKYNEKTKTFEKIENLINKKIRVVFEDNLGNLWLGIHQGGINFISKDSSVFQHISKNTGLTDNSILAIFVDKQNKVWIGTDGGGLNIWDIPSNTFQYYTQSNLHNTLKSNVIRSIFEDSKRNMWLGSYLGGVTKFDTEKKLFETFKNKENDSTSLSHNDVTAIIEDRLGNLWCGTNGGGLNLYDFETKSFTHFKHNKKKTSIINDWIISLYLDKSGFIWIGTYWGACKFDPLTFKTVDLTITQTKGENAYFCFLEDSKNQFWAGTWSGLKLINKETGEILETFTIKDGLPNNVINGIQEDSKGNLWISTNNGMSCFDFKTRSFKNFFQKDGLQSNEFIHGAFAKGNSGDLFYGGINGISRFFPDDIKFPSQQPKVVLTDFLIFNKSVKIGKLTNDKTVLKESISETQSIELAYNDNSFTFEFRAIEYNLPEKVHYACRMKGFNEEWNYYDFNKNSVTFTSLDYGTYTFEVKASTSENKWGETTSIKIIILPPLWLRWWAFIIYFISLSAIIYLNWRIYQSRLREKNKMKEERLKRQKDKEIDQEKLQFFTNISHEFRTPLTLIIGPLETMLDAKDETLEKRQKFELMHRNANRLLRLINQLMDLRKLDAGKVKLNASKQNIVAFLEEIHSNFSQLAESRKIKFYLKKEFSALDLWFDEDKMDKIFFNLLSNAFKFTGESGNIFIEIKNNSNPNFVAILIKDTGKGIKESKLSHIFERFFQADSKSELQQGTGIGLWLTKNYVELHSGEIFVESKSGSGTTFTLLFPKGEKHLTHEQKNITKEPIIHLQSPIIEDTKNLSFDTKVLPENHKKQTILLVEDDDEIRNYLKEGLSAKYHIKEAVNGLEGLNSAKKILPDLVITDVMMPEMDGITLCRHLKQELQTCHIPVIMLTAKTSIEHRIEGLETGADSYIPKPFNPKHLSIRIEKLLELRQRLIEKFSNEIGFQTEKIAITSADDKLLQKVMAIIKEKIADTDLNVESLSEKIGMSRGHLQRKLKSLTGQNPNEFIRIIRLKQAAEILSTNDIGVSEVSYLVGFSSPSYFSTCFTKQFNISPTQFKDSLIQAKIKNN